MLPQWNLFTSSIYIYAQESYFDLNVDCEEKKVTVSYFSDDVLHFKFVIRSDYSVEAYRSKSPISVNHILGYQHKLSRWSQLDNIITYIKNSAVDSEKETKFHVQAIKDINHNTSNMEFLCDQISLALQKDTQRRYSVKTIHIALQQYLSNRSSYNELRKVLTLPNRNTLKSIVNVKGEVGTPSDADSIIRAYTSKSSHRLFSIIFDEVYILPSARYNSGHIVGMSHDDPTKLARTILAIMIRVIGSSDAFVVRLIPTYSLKANDLKNHLLQVIQCVRKHGGTVISLVSDNHPTNRSVYTSFKINSEFLGNDSPTSEHSNFVLISDPVHLFKNIRNNWLTATNGEINFLYKDKTITAKWDHISAIYHTEKNNIVRRTTLTLNAIDPNCTSKQNVKLVLQIFNTKTVAALRQDGYLDTAEFVSIILKLWNILNIKSPSTHKVLNDGDRAPITLLDERFSFIKDIISGLENTKYSHGKFGRRTLTKETGMALVNTLKAIVHVSNELISRYNFAYVLSAQFQSDQLEGEFGIYRQLSGGNYFVSAEQVMNTAKFRKLKFYHELSGDKSLMSFSQCEQRDCCERQMNDDELLVLNSSITDDITDEEKSTLAYIAGFVTYKHNLTGETIENTSFECEFTDLVSRGKLKYPSPWLLQFTFCTYKVFKAMHPTCKTFTVKQFTYLADCMFITDSNVLPISKTLCNTYFRGFVRKLTEKAVPDLPPLAIKQRKLAKLTSKRL